MSEASTLGAPPVMPTPEDDDVQFTDYFAFSATEKFYLPDGEQYFEFKKMNEGEKAKFQDKTSKDLVLERNSGNARMSVSMGTERHELIKACVVGFHLRRGGKWVDDDSKSRTGSVTLNDFLTLADPVIVENLEKAIRKANPWLLGEMSSADIQKEIDNLTEMLEVAKEREAGEGS